jgi:putative addiction module killer protein
MKYELRKTDIFDRWMARLKDRSVKIKILARLDRIENGNFGDHKQIDKNLFELRFFFGAGYRIYYTIKGKTVVILLTGGNKTTQAKDIKKAMAFLNDLEK